MRRQQRRHNKRYILIDLTSLLDVVFIFLMIILCNQQNVTNEVQVQKAEAFELTEQAKIQLELYTDQLDSIDNLCLVSVNAKYASNNITTRHITILKSGENPEMFESIEMKGNHTAETLKTLESNLRSYIESNKEKPVILSLNEKDENILYRDEKEILKIFDTLKQEFPNVYKK